MLPLPFFFSLPLSLSINSAILLKARGFWYVQAEQHLSTNSGG